MRRSARQIDLEGGASTNRLKHRLGDDGSGRARRYHTVSTSPVPRMRPSRVTRGSARARAVARMNRSHGSPAASRGIAVAASATATSIGCRSTLGDDTISDRSRVRSSTDTPCVVCVTYQRSTSVRDGHDDAVTRRGVGQRSRRSLRQARRTLDVPDDGVRVGDDPHAPARSRRANSRARSNVSESTSGRCWSSLTRVHDARCGCFWNDDATMS